MRLIRGAPLGDKKAFGGRNRDRARAGFQDLLADAGQRRRAAGVRLVLLAQSRVRRARLAGATAPGGSRRFGDRLCGGQCRAAACASAAVDPAKPVELALSLTYAACKTICVPEKGEAALTLASGVPEGLYSALIEAAAREVPKRVEPAALGLDRPQAAMLWLAPARTEPGSPRSTWGPGAYSRHLRRGPENWLFERRALRERRSRGSAPAVCSTVPNGWTGRPKFRSRSPS